MDIEQDIVKFRIDMLRKMPFYGDILTHLPFEKRLDIGTAATDGFKVYYNPNFLTNLRDREGIGAVNFVLMHEVFHILLQHPSRGRGRNRDIWNVAADLVVNDMLVRQLTGRLNGRGIPFRRPYEGIFSNIRDNDTVEFLYEYHLRINEEHKKKQDEEKQDKKAKKRKRTGKRIVIFQERSYGGHINNKEIAAPCDLFTPPKASENDNMDAKSMDSETFVRELVMDAAHRGIGQDGFFIPDALVRMYSLAKDSKKLNWRRLLRNHLSEAVSEETSYSTPERKYLHMDLIVPGHSLGEQMEEVWAFVDSSGSVGKKEMEEFLTQLYRIVKEFQCTLHLCYWDTSVNAVYRNIRREKDVLKSVPCHTGGTDINCVYRWISQNHVRPEIMLILTDGYFGTVSEENRRRLKRDRTVIVLSRKNPPAPDQLSKIGTPAYLGD